jgi:UDP-N-acetylmuramoylalanine-D-glutamate ligase
VVVEFETRDARAHGALLRAYETELARGRTALGAADVPPLVVHEHKAGLIVGYPAVIDTMLAMAELSEWAGKSACSIALGQGALSIESVLPVLSSMVAAQDNPGLRALVAEAQRRGLPLLWDDALVTVGTGRASVSFEIAKVPAVAAVPWDTLGRIPVALVTGTNGKTTSSRWLSHVCTAAGYGVGTTSTDGVIIRGVLHDEGDWTGPAGARVVLRSPEVDLAVLETARGGILRRGLAVDDVHAALITNVSADHFGAYGIDDVPGMVRAKGVVAHAVRSDGAVVLNAGDQGLVALSNSVRGNVVFFADVDGGANKGAAVAEAHVAAGGTAWLAKEGRIVRASPQGSQDIAAVNALPLTFGGRARYNVENALGVAAVAHALGVSDTNIAKSLAEPRPRAARDRRWGSGAHRFRTQPRGRPGPARSRCRPAQRHRRAVVRHHWRSWRSQQWRHLFSVRSLAQGCTGKDLGPRTRRLLARPCARRGAPGIPAGARGPGVPYGVGLHRRIRSRRPS